MGGTAAVITAVAGGASVIQGERARQDQKRANRKVQKQNKQAMEQQQAQFDQQMAEEKKQQEAELKAQEETARKKAESTPFGSTKTERRIGLERELMRRRGGVGRMGAMTRRQGALG